MNIFHSLSSQPTAGALNPIPPIILSDMHRKRLSILLLSTSVNCHHMIGRHDGDFVMAHIRMAIYLSRGGLAAMLLLICTLRVSFRVLYSTAHYDTRPLLKQRRNLLPSSKPNQNKSSQNIQKLVYVTSPHVPPRPRGRNQNLLC